LKEWGLNRAGGGGELRRHQQPLPPGETTNKLLVDPQSQTIMSVTEQTTAALEEKIRRPS